MPSTDANIAFLIQNLDEIQGPGRPEAVLLLFEAMKVSMTNTQFDLAMMDLTMSEENRYVAYLFLVEQHSSARLEKEQGVSASRLSKVLKRVMSNYKQQLSALNLVSAEYLLDRQTARLVKELEDHKISEAKIQPYLPPKAEPSDAAESITKTKKRSHKKTK